MATANRGPNEGVGTASQAFMAALVGTFGYQSESGVGCLWVQGASKEQEKTAAYSALRPGFEDPAVWAAGLAMDVAANQDNGAIILVWV